MLSFAPEVWWCVLAAGLRLLLEPSGPLGYEKPFYMLDAPNRR